MSNEAELKLFKLYQGMTIKQIQHRLDIANTFINQRQAELRVKLCNLNIRT